MLDRNNIPQFKGALTSALRTTRAADSALTSRFVELKPGILSTLASGTNHLVTGRRGVGKSTTLAVLQGRIESEGSGRVIFVDAESHKERRYPDVLIEIYKDILGGVLPKRGAPWGERARIRKNIKRIIRILDGLAHAAAVTVESTSHEIESKRDVGGGVQLGRAVLKDLAHLKVDFGLARNYSQVKSRVGEDVKRKEDYLRDLSPVLGNVLESCAKLTSGHGADSLILVIDDFYFIEKEVQPRVLDHLHGITKRSQVWLKVGSVQSRTQTYKDGDPPLGMQSPHDLQHLSLDVGLEEFHTAKEFLEDVADGVLQSVGIRLRDVLNEKARERAVLIVGGAVARDYFDLLITAADIAYDRWVREGAPGEGFTIGTEAVQEAGGRRLERKGQDLKSDAGRDVERLEGRFDDLVKFVRDRETYFFLIPTRELDSDWGREVVELEDLRFVHRVALVRPNTATWRKVDTVVFMVDMAAIVQKRMRKAPIEFWKPGKQDELRKASWIYAPEWLPMSDGKRAVVESKMDENSPSSMSDKPNQKNECIPGEQHLFDIP